MKKVDLKKVLENGATVLQRDDLRKTLGGFGISGAACLGIKCYHDNNCDIDCPRCDIDPDFGGLCAT